MTNGMVWAAVVAIVCGIAIPSLLAGSRPPWIFVLATLLAGLIVITARWYREVRRARHVVASIDGSRLADPETPRARHIEETPRHSPMTAPQTSSTRRAGARSESLGVNPRPPRKDDSAR
jgi:hypothetical protein